MNNDKMISKAYEIFDHLYRTFDHAELLEDGKETVKEVYAYHDISDNWFTNEEPLPAQYAQTFPTLKEAVQYMTNELKAVI